VLNEEQKRQRFKASIFTRARCETANNGVDISLGQGVDDWSEDQDIGHQKREMEGVTSIRVSVIKTTKRPNPEEECTSNYIENTSCSSSLTEEESQLLWKYVHKKFRKEKEIRKRSSDVLTDNEESAWKKSKTRALSLSGSFSGEFVSGSFLKSLDLTSSLVDVDSVLDQLTAKFEDNWRTINFGEQVISEYIQFCEHKKEFQPAFWHVVNLNLRKRCINFLTNLEIFDKFTKGPI